MPRYKRGQIDTTYVLNGRLAGRATGPAPRRNNEHWLRSTDRSSALGRLSANAPSGGCVPRNNSASVMERPGLWPNARRLWLTSMPVAGASGPRRIIGRNHEEFANTWLTSRRWPRNSSLPTNLSHAGWSGRGRLPEISIRRTSESVAMTDEPASASSLPPCTDAPPRIARAVPPAPNVARPKMDRRHLSRASRGLAPVCHRHRSRWRSTALRQSRSKPTPPISSPTARRSAHPQSLMDRHAPARDGSALLQRYCNEIAIAAPRVVRNFTQLIDFIMGRDGFEPSTSGLKVPWAPDSFLALCFY